MLGTVLFAQGVVAANACDVLRGNVNQAFASQVVEVGETHCHDEGSSNANACLDHCTQGDRVNVDQVTHVFAAPGVAVLVAEVPVQVAITPSFLASSSVGINTGPPVSIRFCSFQI